MTFNSLAYLIFLPFTVCVHFLLSARCRWGWLLIASCFFYAFFIPKYLLVLFFIIIVDYSAGIYIESKTGFARRMGMIVSIFVNLSVLVSFKYFDFFNTELHSLANFLGWNYDVTTLHWILPLGLSFHTFQAMSYTLEVYHGRQQAERHLGIYALYVLFFPQLVAGPIERPQNLLPQFHRMPEFKGDKAASGLRLILWGLFKKSVLADRLALYVDSAYGSQLTHGFAFWIANICFAFQIYYDFSGYTDIARGSSRILGIELMKNFDFPYFSTSVREFWRRWHISLSTWFRDYVYIPLGGSSGARNKTVRNLLSVFLLSGLWHGANLTFVAWGFLHFIYVAVPLYLGVVISKIRLPDFLSRVATFVLILIAWVFFRAGSIDQANEVLMEMVLLRSNQWLILKEVEVQVAIILIVGTTVGEWLWYQKRLKLDEMSIRWRWTGYYALTLAILAFGVFNRKQFIYFQF